MKIISSETKKHRQKRHSNLGNFQNLGLRMQEQDRNKTVYNVDLIRGGSLRSQEDKFSNFNAHFKTRHDHEGC